MILRKIFMLLAALALVAVITLTVSGLVPTFKELDFGDPAAHFTKEKTRYDLTVTAEDGGTVEGAEETYEEGAEVSITARANDGYVFNGWYSNNGTPLSSSETYTFTMEKNTHVIAKFVEVSE